MIDDTVVGSKSLTSALDAHTIELRRMNDMHEEANRQMAAARASVSGPPVPIALYQRIEDLENEVSSLKFIILMMGAGMAFLNLIRVLSEEKEKSN